MNKTLTLNDSDDVLKYLDAGISIVNAFRAKGCESALFQCFADVWLGGLALVAGVDWDAADSPSDTNAQRQWRELIFAAEDEAGAAVEETESGNPALVEVHMRECQYTLERMRVLAVRGEEYSPHLTFDELAADLRAHGIRLDGDER